jgi:hypothetical protein
LVSRFTTRTPEQSHTATPSPLNNVQFLAKSSNVSTMSMQGAAGAPSPASAAAVGAPTAASPGAGGVSFGAGPAAGSPSLFSGVAVATAGAPAAAATPTVVRSSLTILFSCFE